MLNTAPQKTNIPGHAGEQDSAASLKKLTNAEKKAAELASAEPCCLSSFPAAWALGWNPSLSEAAAQMGAGPFRMREKVFSSVFSANYSPLRAGRGLRGRLILALQCGPSSLYPDSLSLPGPWCPIVVQVPFSQVAVGNEKGHAVASSWSSCFWALLLEHFTVISNSMFFQVNSITQKFPCLIKRCFELSCMWWGYLPARCSSQQCSHLCLCGGVGAAIGANDCFHLF